jgi:hypothetical protein
VSSKTRQPRSRKTTRGAWFRMPPASGAHTSTSRVSGPENQVPVPGSKDRCRAILKNRERACHDGADRMTANIFSSGIAAAVPIKPCHAPHRADFGGLAEHVMRAQLPFGSAVLVVPQHRHPQPPRPSRCCKKLHLAMILGTGAKADISTRLVLPSGDCARYSGASRLTNLTLPVLQNASGYK